ncbi:MAG: threonine synthase [Pseudomonadota bacterium]
MRYHSTRGQAPALDFEEAMLAGLAVDGGLYLPDAWPQLSVDEIAGLAGADYAAAAATILAPFLGGVYSADTLRAMADRAYAGFAHPARAPLLQIGANEWILELHRGPTLAFKDFAMQLIGEMFERTLTRRGRRATVIGATSGDTGSAAMEAFRGLDAVDVFILYPHGRVSEVQRRQMTTPSEANVHALAVEGSFDDCQALVKAMFADAAFREKMSLAAVNSINWARVAAQVVYYFTAAVALGGPARRVSFSVPTGNFGDIYAGWTAKRMGLPIERLVVATNENDILHRTLETGRYAPQTVRRTTAPSMDIQVSSNFERALADAHLDAAGGRDAGAVDGLMAALREEGGFTIGPEPLEALRAVFDSARVDEAAVSAEIRRVRDETGEVIDPHTAIGVAAGRARRGDPQTPMICLGCAHAAKFPDAVEAACGVRPALPPHMADLFERPERVTVVPNALDAVEAEIAARANGRG